MTDLEHKNYPNVGQSFGIVGIMILGAILMTPVMLIHHKFIDREALTLIYYLLAVGVPFWIVYSIRKRKTGIKTFHFKIDNKRIIPFVIVAAIALLFGIISPISDLIPMPELLKKAFLDLAKQTGFSSFLYMVIAAPILEELIFRGIMLDGLLRKYSPIKSILISSLLFGLVHLNPWQFIAGLFLGVFMGWVYYKSKSLSFTIIIHAAVNLSGFLMRCFTDFDPSSMDKTLVESYGSILNLVIVISVSLLLIPICIYYLNNEFKKNEIKVQPDSVEDEV
jgi:membrane protease YdiL (CAAX protease family)